MKFEIKSRFSGAVLSSLETDSLKLAVIAAVKSGADLRGADLCDKDGNKLLLIGERPCLQIGPLGSRADYLLAFLTDKGVYVRAGCFFDTLPIFAAAVARNHGDSVHGIEYRAAIQFIECHAAQWTPPAETQAAA